MLLISRPEMGEQTVTLRLEGQLVGPWVDELRKTARKFQNNGHRLTLDLSDVTFADSTGVGLLLDLQQQAVSLAGCSPFLEEQLKRALVV
jgi:anti-anti-sigma factor